MFLVVRCNNNQCVIESLIGAPFGAREPFDAAFAATVAFGAAAAAADTGKNCLPRSLAPIRLPHSLALSQPILILAPRRTLGGQFYGRLSCSRSRRRKDKDNEALGKPTSAD